MIRLENVAKAYHDPRTGRSLPVLDGVSFHVAESEFVCVLGPSGCGKTTLLNLVAGFLRPTSGRVLFNGGQVTRPGPDRAVVFQDPTLFPWLTARRNIEFGLRGIVPSAKDRLRKALDALSLVGLDACADEYPHALSGGMRQRVALARVLVLEPKALLMDEPFGSLDANSRERLQDKLLAIWQSHRRTVLFVTHNVEEAAYLADRVIVMGPSPDNMRAEVPVDLPRPRHRDSDDLRTVTARLRSHSDELPCCIPPRKGE